LDHAIALSLRRNPESSKSRYIRAIILVKGVDFYGFHASYKPYLKVLVADPSLVSRVVAILQSGSVMGNRFRIFESHLSYVLQFMCDFDLHGCGVINLEDALERGPQAEDDSASQPTTAPLYGVSPYFRESRVQLEVDAIAPHILNRHKLCARHLHHKLEIPAPPLPPEPLILSVRELWDDERKRRQALGLDPSPEIPVDPSESSRAPGAGWISEARWWDEIKNRIQQGQTSLHPAVDSKGSEWHHGVMTTFESVEAIWEKRYRTWKPFKKPSKGDDKPQDAPIDYSWDTKTLTDAEVKDEQIDVDISMLSTGDMSQLDQEDDLKWRDEILGDLNADDTENEDEDPTLEDEVNDDIDPVDPVEQDISPAQRYLYSSPFGENLSYAFYQPS
jgi:DNA polymerase zeta